MLKLLGISESLHASWLMSDKLTPYASMYTTIKVRNLNTIFLTTPKVTEAARNHFACSTLVGLPFENN
jgi:hypothetical protein